MKKFLIGIIVGILLCTTGTYDYLKKKVQKKVPKQKVEKVEKAVKKAFK